jgi:SSS family solute:Na+ symporter
MMTWTMFAIAGCLTMVAGCSTKESVNAQRQRLIHLLEREARSNTGWVRIHAADALLDHGQCQTAADLLRAEAGTAGPPYRIGVWRVLARASGTAEERLDFRERIRRALLNPQAPDRLNAAESLAKLGLAPPADRAAIRQWLAEVDEAASAYALWLLVLSGNSSERAGDETRLANLLDSANGAARLRAAFALGRIQPVSAATFGKLKARLASEPGDSPARPYIIGAVLLHSPGDSTLAADLRRQLAGYLDKGKPNEQLEAATVLGRRGTSAEVTGLTRLLENPEADARIGAANGLLYLLQ